MNYMSEVAKLFGKKLGEEFSIKYAPGMLEHTYRVKLVEGGIEVYTIWDTWEKRNGYLVPLLLGYAKIVED